MVLKEYYRSWIESREKEENLSLLSLSFDFFALFILIFSGQERKFFQSQMKKVIVGSNGPVWIFSTFTYSSPLLTLLTRKYCSDMRRAWANFTPELGFVWV